MIYIFPSNSIHEPKVTAAAVIINALYASTRCAAATAVPYLDTSDYYTMYVQTFNAYVCVCECIHRERNEYL